MKQITYLCTIKYHKKGIKWKIREGAITTADKDGAQLLIDIFSKLEYLMKKDFEKLFPQEHF